MPIAGFAQEICGFWIISGRTVDIQNNGRVDTFYLKDVEDSPKGGSMAFRNIHVTPASPTVIHDTIYITRVETVYVAPPDDVDGLAESPMTPMPPGFPEEEGGDHAAMAAPADLSLDSDSADHAMAGPEEMTREKKRLIRLGAVGDVVIEGLAYAAVGVGVAGGVVVAGVSLAGHAIYEFGKILLRPFQKCDCEDDGAVVAVAASEDGEGEPTEAEPGKVHKKIYRHGRRVRDGKKPRRKRARGKKGPRCGKVK